jgi:hypothetical protein
MLSIFYVTRVLLYHMQLYYLYTYIYIYTYVIVCMYVSACVYIYIYMYISIHGNGTYIDPLPLHLTARCIKKGTRGDLIQVVPANVAVMQLQPMRSWR